MKANKYISKTEHFALLTVAFIAFIIVLSIFAWQVSVAYDNFFADKASKIRFSGSANEFQTPPFHLLTLFIFIAILKTKRFFLSSLLTVFYAFIFIYGLYVRAKYSSFESDTFVNSSFIEQFYLVAHDFDFLAAFFISILLFWQISILLRMLIKTSQKESVLP
jgi:hypothetical protein